MTLLPLPGWFPSPFKEFLQECPELLILHAYPPGFLDGGLEVFLYPGLLQGGYHLWPDPGYKGPQARAGNKQAFLFQLQVGAFGGDHAGGQLFSQLADRGQLAARGQFTGQNFGSYLFHYLLIEGNRVPW
ncbi:flagellar motor switch protein [Moorella thermoacetica Y72]|uniref:Flagellar motor switch protein n=1 Tax=Moorella thermoacetica Y72 TaxID=1325331 RepID=A0A0S6UFE6_NEOTH|nr:flagellar motor switch protein [Moorella thermoacetica Y72]